MPRIPLLRLRLSRQPEGTVAPVQYLLTKKPTFRTLRRVLLVRLM